MTPQELFKATNPDLQASLAAMKRAAAMARQTAIVTDTEIIVVQDGRPVRIPAQELRRQQAIGAPSNFMRPEHLTATEMGAPTP